MNSKLNPHFSVPKQWEELDAILDDTQGTIVVVGSSDSGKTTLTTYVLNRLLKKGILVGIVDSDVGQSEIGPPSTISGNVVNSPINRIADVKPLFSYFAGFLSPSLGPMEHLIGTCKVVEKIKTMTPLVLIDTTGFVSSVGRMIKKKKIELLKPELVLALQRKDELNSIIDYATLVSRVVVLDPVQETTQITALERQEFRKAKFNSFFNGCINMDVKLQDYLSESFPGLGKKIHKHSYSFYENKIGLPIVYGEEIDGNSHLVVPDSSRFPGGFADTSIPGLTIYSLSYFKNLLIGITDTDGFLGILGAINKIDFERLSINIKAVKNIGIANSLHLIKFSPIRLT